MKLVELECQNCGAALKIEEGADTVNCPYCNATYKLDDEVQHVKYDDMENSGYEFEKGRIKAQREHYANSNVETQTKFPIFIIPIFIIITVGFFIFMVTRMQAARNRIEDFSNNVSNTMTQNANEKAEALEKQAQLEIDRQSFNWRYSNGRKATLFVKSMLNDVVENNRTNKERFITINFNDISTQDAEQILEIEKQLKDNSEYDVLIDYDDDGFVNIITIK